MASKLKVDEITTSNETGNLIIPGNVGLDGSQATSSWKLPRGTEAQRPTVGTVGGEIRFNIEQSKVEVFSGTEWLSVGEDSFDGSSPAKASTSALAIKQLTNTNNDGYYWIKVNGFNNDQPFEIYADMNTDGGGWTLVHTAVGPGGGWNNTNILSRNVNTPSNTSNYSILGAVDNLKQSGTWQFMIEASTTIGWPNGRGEKGGIFSADATASFQDSTPRNGGFARLQDFPNSIFGNGNMYERVPWINQGNGSPYPSALFTTFPGSPNWWGTITEGGTSTSYITGPWMSSAAGGGSDQYKWVWVR